MQHFKTLSAYLDYLELPRPEHPMFSVFSAMGKGFLPCPKESPTFSKGISPSGYRGKYELN